jgi:tetratricopeptide (TPR) repeat protein
MRVLVAFIGISFLLLSCGGKMVEERREDVSLSNQKALAVASLRRGNLQQAVEDIKKAEGINDRDPDVHLIKGVIYFALKDYKESEASYKRAIELKPDYSEARYNLCGLYLTLDNLDRAIEQCSKAASDVVYKSRVNALTSLGTAYFRKGDTNKAKEYYEQALQLNPAFVYTHNELGKLYLATGKEEEAIEEFKKAIDGYNLYDEAYYNLGLAYLKIGKTADACQSFKRVVEVSPTSAFGVNAKSYVSSLCVDIK